MFSLDKIIDYIRSRFLRPVSIPAVFIASFAMYCGIRSFIEGHPNWGIPDNIHSAVFVVCIIAFFAYASTCFLLPKLPRAKMGSLAVLFIIDTQSDREFEDVKYKLVNEFSDIISESQMQDVEIVCIRRKQIGKKNLQRKEDADKLLQSTNCLFFICVKLVVDDIANIESYDMKINYDFLRPIFETSADQELRNDMKRLFSTFSKKRFSKSNVIDTFNSTAQALSYSCEYILGVTFLLSEDLIGASNILLKLYDELKSTQLLPDLTPLREILMQMTVFRLYAVFILLGKSRIRSFENEHSIDYLKESRDYHIKANEFIADTYEYYMGMAYVSVILDKDISKAKKAVQHCKIFPMDGLWRYSEAFLSAYQDYPIKSVYLKYQQAFPVPYNLVNLVDYIEFVIGLGSGGSTLHFAAALVYKQMNEIELMREHMDIFSKKHIIDRRDKSFLIQQGLLQRE